jgi:hypothetical protein
MGRDRFQCSHPIPEAHNIPGYLEGSGVVSSTREEKNAPGRRKVVPYTSLDAVQLRSSWEVQIPRRTNVRASIQCS